MAFFKKSRFTTEMVVKNNDEDLIALYHTMTTGFVIMHQDDWQRLCQLPDRDRNSEDVSDLKNQGFLISTDADETTVFESWKNQQVHDFSTMSSKVLVTRKCNNRCTYCIIEPEAEDMSSQTALEMDNFYCRLMDDKHPQSVRDDYLGGEPLLNAAIIKESTGRRSAFCRKRNINYGFSLTTNGTLLEPSLIRALKKNGLTGIRVSMAGPADIHDKLRPSIRDTPTYKRIMANMESISGLVPIMIECQYDSGSDDYKRLPEMMDEFYERGIHVEDMAFTPILERRAPGEFHNGMGDPVIALYLNHEAKKRGYIKIDEPPSNLCKADFRSAFVFDTDGSIIPCPSLQKGEMSYGHVSSGVDFVAESQLIARNLPDKCMNECAILPLCMGGCRLQALTADNNFSGINCHYDAYMLFLEDYITQQASNYLPHR